MSTPQPETPPPVDDHVALEPDDFPHGLTAEEASAFIQKEVG